MFATGTAGILSSWELNRLAAALQGTYGWSVQSAAVTFSSGLTFAYASAAAGDYTVNSVSGSAITGSTVALSTQDPTNPRVDVIVTTSAGSVSALAGTPAALTSTSGPVPPTPSASQLEIARIYVPASGTSLSSASITDKRATLTANNVFDMIRTQFRANRRMVAETSGGGYISPGLSTVGSGLAYMNTTTPALVSVGGEFGFRLGDTMSANNGVANSIASSTTVALPPNKSPRMLVRVVHPTASANVTDWLVGFFDANSATPSGAYLRAVTTGNIFAVCRQGGSESTTDLGALSRTVVLGYEIETTDAGVTWIFRNQAGTVLVSQTSNVPTAGTNLAYGVEGTFATSAIPCYVMYLRVEATIA